MRKSSLRLCAYNLRRLLSTPRAWAVLILTALFLDNQFAPIRLLLVADGLRVSFAGLIFFTFNDATFTMLFGLGLLLLLIDAPPNDEAQTLLISRAGRSAWARGQALYALATAALYMLVACLILFCLAMPWIDLSGAWSDGLTAFVDGAYETYDSLLDYDPWLIEVVSPTSGAALMLLTHFLLYGFLASVSLAVGALSRSGIGLYAAAMPLAVDAVAEEYFESELYYFSPATLSRLSGLDCGDGMGRPPIWYGIAVLLALLAAALFAATRLCRTKELKP